jgi:hypothetical protein
MYSIPQTTIVSSTIVGNLRRIGKAEKKSCGIAKRSNPMVQTSVEMCQEEQQALWRRIVEYVVIVTAGLFFAVLVTALVPGFGSTAHAATAVQPTGMVGSTGENVVQPTGIVDPKDPNVVQPTGIVDPKDPNIVQPTGIVDPEDPTIVQPTGIVGSTGKNVVQRTDIVGRQGNFAALTGIVGHNGSLVQATSAVGPKGELIEPIAFVGPKARDTFQQILIAKTTNGNIEQEIVNVFHVCHSKVSA